MRIALYARVSTSRQQQSHTIEQQLTRLRSYVTSQSDWSLAEEHIFCDDGYSGAKLKRPGLDHLRDQAAQAAFELVLLTAPDRLARNYVHQMVLLEELERAGCRVQFLDRPVSDDPHEQLVLQIRGAVAEYERTLIAERMRRGRQTKVRNGQLLPWTHTPYGYRAHPERPRDVALLQLDPPHAAIVQELFEDYGNGGVSLYQLALRLTKRQIPSPTGGAHWTANTIRLILLNPCYAGTAYSQRTRLRQPSRRKSPLQPVGRGESWTLAPPEEWIGVPVPAIVSQEVFDRVQARLATNQQLSRRSTRHEYLLRGLVSCGHCHLQSHGRFLPPNYYYYVCRGKANSVQSCHDVRCQARFVPAEQLDVLVWNDLCKLLQHPDMIQLALERAHSGAWLPEELQQRQATIQQALRSLERQRERLFAAYLAEAVELPEFERRQRELVHQRDDLESQARKVAHYSEQLLQAREAIPTIQAMCERLQVGLEQATFAQRRQLVELLIDCVVVTDEQVEIRYVIPTTEASTHIRFCHLRKDYFNPHPQPIPAVLDSLWVQVGQQHPTFLMPHAPDDDQRPRLPSLLTKYVGLTNPAASLDRHQVGWRHRFLTPGRTNGNAVVEPQEWVKVPLAQVAPQVGAPQAAVNQHEGAPVTRDGRGQMVDQCQDVWHPGALSLRGNDVPGDRNGTAAIQHTDDQGDDAVLMRDGVNSQWQGGRALPPGDDPAQQSRKTLGEFDLRVAGARLVTTILEPLTQPLPCSVSFEEHDEFDQNGSQTGAFGQHRAVDPQRQAQGVSRSQRRQLLRYLLLDLIQFPWKAHHTPWLERFYLPSSCHCDALFANPTSALRTPVSWPHARQPLR